MKRFRHWIAMLAACLIAMPAIASPAAPVEGTDYFALRSPLPAEGGSKVEVIEFFLYGCPHCRSFEAPLKDWVAKQGNAIVFRRVPVNFGTTPEQSQRFLPQQKLYYALEAMGRLATLHEAVFKFLHVERGRLDSDDDVFQFVRGQGLDAKEFEKVYNSFAVQSKLQRAAQLQRAYGIESVPIVAIAGRYVTAPSIIGTSIGRQPDAVLEAGALQVMSWLVARASRQSPPVAAAEVSTIRPR